MGPSTDRSNQASVAGTFGTRPGVGRSPTTLQKLAGLRSDPPMSLPSASATMPVASATAAPPLLPPGVSAGSYGLRVGPNSRLVVCDPAPNSGTLVLPTRTPPARCTRSASTASSVGTTSASSVDPHVVRRPFVGSRSLWATGRPCSGPTGPVRTSASSSSAARARARSSSRVTSALSNGSTASRRASEASSSSRADSSRACSRRASSTAGSRQTSSAGPASSVTRAAYESGRSLRA